LRGPLEIMRNMVAVFTPRRAPGQGAQFDPISCGSGIIRDARVDEPQAPKPTAPYSAWHLLSRFSRARFLAGARRQWVPGWPGLIALEVALHVVADVDVVPFAFRIPNAHMLGRRRVQHSFAFAGRCSGGLDPGVASTNDGNANRTRVCASPASGWQLISAPRVARSASGRTLAARRT
jgi:hypothetical protein